MSDNSAPVTMHVTYRPKKGKEDELFGLVKKHWPTIRDAGLTTNEPATVYRATNKREGTVEFIEIFSWKDGDASSTAHQLPEVMAIWEPMGPIMDGMELRVLERVSG